MAGQETTTLTDRTARLLFDQWWEEKRRIAAYHTARMKRHQGTVIPGGDDLRLVTFTHLPSAYNVSSTERRFYPQLCDSIWEIESDASHTNTGERIYVVNMGDLPLFGGTGGGWATVAKAYTDPVFGEVWGVVQVLSEAPYSGAMYEWTAPETIGDWSLNPTEEVLLRIAGGGGNVETPENSGDTRRWVFGYGGDIMLSHPGTYEITVGARVTLSSTDAPRNNETTGAASAGTAHTHTYTVPTSVTARIGVQRNFEPGVSTIGSGSTVLGDSELKIPVSIPNATYEAEKTCTFINQAEPFHGLSYTRLSLYFAVTDEAGYESSGTPEVTLSRAWLIVRPGQKAEEGQDFGNGVNQYPNGRDSIFVWYGSSDAGDEPPYIDKDGAEI